MQVFITGASGFIGSAVGAAFVRAGHRVLGLTRSKANAKHLTSHEIEPIVGSMDAPQAWIARARTCSVLVHTAAEYSARYLELDAQVVETLATCIGTTGAAHTLLYTSGVWVYGDTGHAQVDESSALHPPPLVAPRVKTEERVLAANGATLRTLVIRPGCVYGGSGSLTARWFSTAHKDGAAEIVGDGAQHWAMVHREDLADLYVRAAESSCVGEVFNATDGTSASVHDCASAASAAVGALGRVAKVSVADAAKKVGPVAECLALDQHVDASKAQRLLGWRPKHAGFIAGVDRYAASWKALATH